MDLCSSPPWTPGTTCREDMVGWHAHVFYTQNSFTSVLAMNKIYVLANEAFDLGTCLYTNDSLGRTSWRQVVLPSAKATLFDSQYVAVIRRATNGCALSIDLRQI